MQHHTNEALFIFSTVQFNMVQFIYDVQHYEYKFIMRAEKKWHNMNLCKACNNFRCRIEKLCLGFVLFWLIDKICIDIFNKTNVIFLMD